MRIRTFDQLYELMYQEYTNDPRVRGPKDFNAFQEAIAKIVKRKEITLTIMVDNTRTFTLEGQEKEFIAEQFGSNIPLLFLRSTDGRVYKENDSLRYVYERANSKHKRVVGPDDWLVLDTSDNSTFIVTTEELHARFVEKEEETADG